MDLKNDIVEKCGRNGFIKEVETSPQRSGGRGMLMVNPTNPTLLNT